MTAPVNTDSFNSNQNAANARLAVDTAMQHWQQLGIGNFKQTYM